MAQSGETEKNDKHARSFIDSFLKITSEAETRHLACDDVVVSFDDKIGEKRTDDQIDQMIEELRVVANKYDFDYSCSGSPESFYKMLKLRYANKI